MAPAGISLLSEMIDGESGQAQSKCGGHHHRCALRGAFGWLIGEDTPEFTARLLFALFEMVAQRACQRTSFHTPELRILHSGWVDASGRPHRAVKLYSGSGSGLQNQVSFAARRIDRVDYNIIAVERKTGGIIRPVEIPDCTDIEVGVDFEKAHAHHLHFRLPYCKGCGRQLTVDVGGVDHISIHHSDVAYAGADKRLRTPRAHTPYTENDDAGIGQPTRGLLSIKQDCALLIHHWRYFYLTTTKICNFLRIFAPK